jgi:hypothetical protein
VQVVFRTGGRTTFNVEAPEGVLETAKAAPDWRAACLDIFDAADVVTMTWNGAGASLTSSSRIVTDRAAARWRVLEGLADGLLPMQG